MWGRNMKKVFSKILVSISIKFPILQTLIFSCLTMLIIHLSLGTVVLQEYCEYPVLLEQQTNGQVFVDFADALDQHVDEFYGKGNKAFLVCNGKEHEILLYCDVTYSQLSKYYFIRTPDINLDADRIKIVSVNQNLFESIVNRLTRRNYEK